MLPVRLIPCLDINNGRVVKGIRFESLRDAGDPVERADFYNRDGADEIAVLDVGATVESRNTLIDIIRNLARRVFVPLSAGGGVRKVDDMRAMLEAGADKVSVCSSALARPELLTEGAKRFGNQCIVISIDARRKATGWQAMAVGGSRDSGRDAVSWAIEAVERGAGEILLNSIDRDGTQAGYDLELIHRITRSVSVPVIASGGAGTTDHMAKAVDAGASAVLLASLLHDGICTINDLKTGLQKKGVRVRC
jgi:imidazole glycerol-phosphate synthase subunit HisF